MKLHGEASKVVSRSQVMDAAGLRHMRLATECVVSQTHTDSDSSDL
jgi:hypothetical protein